MASETITVYFEPLGTVDGYTFYHETLVYTNSDGVSYYATAGTSSNSLSSSNGGGSIDPFGTIITQWGPVDSLSTQQLQQWLGPGQNGNPYPTQVLTGNDLSQQV